MTSLCEHLGEISAKWTSEFGGLAKWAHTGGHFPRRPSLDNLSPKGSRILTTFVTNREGRASLSLAAAAAAAADGGGSPQANPPELDLRDASGGSAAEEVAEGGASVTRQMSE